MENRFQLADAYIAKNASVSYLYQSVWRENSTCLLHAPREVDKCSFALDVARSLIERGMTVFYLTTYRMPDHVLAKMKLGSRFYVHESDFGAPDDPADYADIVFKDLEDAIAQTGAKVFIIDSLTRIAALSFGRNASASYLMKRIVALQVRHKVSIMVLHNDKTKASTRTLIELADCEIAMFDSACPSDKPKEKRSAQGVTNDNLPDGRGVRAAPSATADYPRKTPDRPIYMSY